MKYNTGKKELIVKLLSDKAERSFSLVEICEMVAADGHGESTVYRIVSELVSEGSVRRISDGKTRHCTYQYVGGEECRTHLHLKCSKCGRLIHLEKSLSHELIDTLLDRKGFEVEDGSMIFGRCKACAGV
ncbi:MAG: transcriptional repressor [Clostridia bacterium]|nr:transcriptional repressor [Clostridia bacterium]